MVAFAWRLCASSDRRERGTAAAQALFAFSILYLFVLFAVLLVEHGLGGLIGRVAA